MSSTDATRKQLDFLFRYSLQSLSVILILAILARVFFVSSYVMSGASMLPSVWPGDFLVAFKLGAARAKRGDVVALRCPGSRDRTCLKRVIGVAGDRIEFMAGQLVVNGEPVRLHKVSPEVAVEQLGARSWVIWPDESVGVTVPPLIVPPDQVYLLNDKRSDGEDSRHWGPIPASDLEAKAKYIWLSLDWFDEGTVRNWPRLRWPRILRSID